MAYPKRDRLACHLEAEDGQLTTLQTQNLCHRDLPQNMRTFTIPCYRALCPPPTSHCSIVVVLCWRPGRWRNTWQQRRDFRAQRGSDLVLGCCDVLLDRLLDIRRVFFSLSSLALYRLNIEFGPPLCVAGTLRVHGI